MKNKLIYHTCEITSFRIFSSPMMTSSLWANMDAYGVNFYGKAL